MVERRLAKQIRKRFDQLFDEIVANGYDETEVQDILNELEDDLVAELDQFEDE